MSFLAKLFLDNTERLVHKAHVSFQQSVDFIGRPCTYPQGGLINLKIDATHEDLFFDWAVSPTMMKEGYIRFYKTDGMSKFVDLEFWDCYCVEYSASFAHNTPEAMFIDLVLSPGVLRYRDILFEKHWKVTDLNRVNAAPITFADYNSDNDKPDNDAQILECYYTDMEGNKIEELTEDKVLYVIKTQNCIGKAINIDLANEHFNFKYNGQVLENDIIKDFVVNDDVVEIELEVVVE